jgi:hypothetical protein
MGNFPESVLNSRGKFTGNITATSGLELDMIFADQNTILYDDLEEWLEETKDSSFEDRFECRIAKDKSNDQIIGAFDEVKKNRGFVTYNPNHLAYLFLLLKCQ